MRLPQSTPLLMPVQGSDSYDFIKNEDDSLEADVVIIDEASMLNVRLYYSLLAAIPRGGPCDLYRR